jgi:adenylosuccinate lyase
MLALTDAGLSREDAYKTVQTQAMKVWEGKGDFMTLLQSDPLVKKHLKANQMKLIFDYSRYVKHAGAIVDRALKLGGDTAKAA